MRYYSVKDNKVKGFFDSDIHNIVDGMLPLPTFEGKTQVETAKMLSQLTQKGYTLCVTKDNTIYPQKLKKHQSWDGEKVVDNMEQLLHNGIEKIQLKRAKLFEALDKYDLKLSVGRISPTEEQKKEVQDWYETLLVLPERYTDISIDVDDMFPEIPEVVKYFI